VVWFEGTDLEATAYAIADNDTHYSSWDEQDVGGFDLRAAEECSGEQERETHAHCFRGKEAATASEPGRCRR
jgi:hypothetical protein